ncbi:hypothetical protein AK812_SmicGene10723 [Symbiodinium microadriaticum]|uniref:Uncharacterized protein n=1 Tax=Symbiodinium microadriaticum TaxID=2951 RepID=A0A1Q9EEY6_SYMMI|nr:hypothetical protein AK812_SmicGene10723 [Symbiodinium microadriaticum]
MPVTDGICETAEVKAEFAGRKIFESLDVSYAMTRTKAGGLMNLKDNGVWQNKDQDLAKDQPLYFLTCGGYALTAKCGIQGQPRAFKTKGCQGLLQQNGKKHSDPTMLAPVGKYRVLWCAPPPGEHQRLVTLGSQELLGWAGLPNVYLKVKSVWMSTLALAHASTQNCPRASGSWSSCTVKVFSIQPIHLADTGSVAVASPGQWQGDLTALAMRSAVFFDMNRELISVMEPSNQKTTDVGRLRLWIDDIEHHDVSRTPVRFEGTDEGQNS